MAQEKEIKKQNRELVPVSKKKDDPEIKLESHLDRNRPRCQRIIRKPGEAPRQCKAIAIKGRGCCKKHGGGGGRPIVTGAHSKYSLGTLAEYVERIRRHDIKDFKEEIHLLRAQMQQLLEVADQGIPAFNKDGNPVKDDKGKQLYIRMDVLNKAAAVDKLVNTIIGSVERLHDFEKEQKLYISYRALAYIINQLVIIINRFVEDSSTKSAISAEIRNIRIPDELR
jgi:hypothetical protein